jgi:hypothetical protein
VKTDVASWAVQGTKETSGNLICSIFLDAAAQEGHNIALRDKYASMAGEAMAESFLCDDADLVLAAYGSSARVARSAVEALRAQGVKAGLFRPQTLFPFPTAALRSAVSGKRVWPSSFPGDSSATTWPRTWAWRAPTFPWPTAWEAWSSRVGGPGGRQEGPLRARHRERN